MALTVRSAQTIRNGVTLKGTAPLPGPSLPILFEFDVSNYTSGSTLLDISGNGRHATIYGSPVWSSNAGGCFDFASDYNKYIEVPNSSTGWGLNLAENNPSASFSIWAKVSAYGFYQQLGGWRGGLNFWFIIAGTSLTEARFDGGVPYDITVDYTPYFGNWTLITFVVDSANSQTRLYINSVLASHYDGITGAFGNGANNFRLGSHPENAFPTNGAIGGAIAYSRALTDAEVVSEFDRTKTRYGL